jgi:hypothetical protein
MNYKTDNTEKNKKYMWDTYKIYPYLFQEDLYTMSFKKKHTYSINDNHKSNLSFLKIKRIIHDIRYEGYLKKNKKNYQKQYIKCVSKQRTKCFKDLTLQVLGIILNTINQNLLNKEKKIFSIINRHTYKSIQIALTTVEYQWTSSKAIIKGDIYAYLHPEIIFRILQKQIKDTSFLHFLRQILHVSISKLLKQAESVKELSWQELNIFFLNLYIIENENFFCIQLPNIFIVNQFFKKKQSYRTSCIKKITEWKINQIDKIKNYTKKNRRQEFLYSINMVTYHYMRTNNTWFVTIESIEKNGKTFHKRYINFLENRFGCIHKTNNIQYICKNDSTILLGYYLQLKLKNVFIRIENLTSVIIISLQFQAIYLYIPLLIIIRIFVKHGFCHFSGYPISKSGWSILSDNNIINRFKNIQDNLINYYSGSINRKDLWRIQHILHYSCAKTLACKHKTNLRKIWTKYGKNLSVRDPYNQKKISFDIIGTNKQSDSKREKRFWNLYFKQPDSISILVEKIYKTC